MGIIILIEVSSKMTTALTAFTDTALNAYTFTQTTSTFKYYLTAEETVWATYKTEVEKPDTYIVSTQDTNNLAKFSSFVLAVEVTTAGAADDGVCMINSVYGALCLLENSGTNGMDTYRLSVADWTAAVGAFTANEGEVITALKGTTNAL